MWKSTMTGGEQFLRILLALAPLGFSSQDRTTLAHAVAGYLVGGILLMSALFARCVVWKRVRWN